MVHLLDVNLLVALAWPNHTHHAAAHRWFAANSAPGWATCPITQCGLVRISCNPKVVVAAASPHRAVETLRQMIAHPNHLFWPDNIMFPDAPYVPHETMTGHQQVTDCYLVGLAARHGGKLATLDAALLAPLRQHHRQYVAVVPT
jgi:toxin-antitoxin system PIN domain toxin